MNSDSGFSKSISGTNHYCILLKAGLGVINDELSNTKAQLLLFATYASYRVPMAV